LDEARRVKMDRSRENRARNILMRLASAYNRTSFSSRFETGIVIASFFSRHVQRFTKQKSELWQHVTFFGQVERLQCAKLRRTNCVLGKSFTVKPPAIARPDGRSIAIAP